MKTLIVCITLFFAQYATAAVTINIVESNGNVEAVLNGSLDLNAVGGQQGNSTGFDGYQALAGNLSFTAANTEFYAIDVGTWTPFGPGAFGNWDSSGGDAWAMFSDPVIGVPVGYVSGAALSSSGTKNNTTFAALGFTPGVYVTTLTNGQNTDTVTVDIGGAAPPVVPAAPVPSLGTWALIMLAVLLGLFGMGARASRSKR